MMVRWLLVATIMIAGWMQPACAAPECGVLILAHGGSPEWNDAVRHAVREADLTHPTAIAFGMGMHSSEVQAIAQAVEQLEAEDIERIVAVPLLVSSSSQIVRQFAYLLGLSTHGPWPEHAHPIRVRVPIAMTSAMDADPALADILVERAQALSDHPPDETVVLVAHGPNDAKDNIAWLAALGRVAQEVQRRGGFRLVRSVTMRDDAALTTKAEALRELRQLVQDASRLGRVLVVPVLLARGGIEHKIPKRLQGLDYAYDGQVLLPHPKVSQWIAAQVEKALAQDATTSPVAHLSHL